jgi:hypothetical protein
MKTWFAQAWADWIQPLGGLILAAFGYLLYRFDLLGERVAGVGLTVLIVLGVLAMGSLPAFKLVRSTSQRVMLLSMMLIALVAAGWPTMHVAFSPSPLASVRLTPAALSATAETGHDGPYEVVVSGHFRQAAATEVEANYTLKVVGTGSEDISGTIKRAMHRNRTSRRGGTSISMEERTEVVHRVDGVRGSALTISTDGIDDQLDGELDVAVRSAGPRPEIFWALGALAILLALILDARLGAEVREEDRKVRGPRREQSYLTIVTGILLVYSINFPMEATPHALVRAAIGAFVLALLTGGAGGWLLAGFVRLATRPRRRSA